MFFVGTTRFSVYQPGSIEWKASGKFFDEQSYLNYLYSEQRMRYRLSVFIKISLPLLAEASRGINFIHILQYSKQMPKRYLDELKEAQQRFPFLHLVEVSVDLRFDNVWKKVRQELQTMSIQQGVFGFFNLDDDDLLALDYFLTARTYLKAEFVGMYLSFGAGFTGFYDDETQSVLEMRRCYVPKINIGLLAISEYRDNNFFIPARGSHLSTDCSVPVILDSRTSKYFWMRSFHQDTAVDTVNLDDKLAKINKEMSRHANDVNDTEVERLFPTLFAKIPGAAMHNLQSITLPKQLAWVAVSVPLAIRGKRVSIKYKVTSAANTPINAALISFVFSGDVTPLDGVLAKSSNSSIGFYRYLNTTPGSNEGEVSITVPEMAMLREIKLQLWKDAVVTLQQLDIQQSA